MTVHEIILDHITENEQRGLNPHQTLGGIVRDYLKSNHCDGLTRTGCATHGCRPPYLWLCQQDSHGLPLDCVAVEGDHDDA